jgi:hypothetical protein
MNATRALLGFAFEGWLLACAVAISKKWGLGAVVMLGGNALLFLVLILKEK